jgi:hypothetical protein
MKRSELKEAIKAKITSVLSEEMTDKEREDKLQQAKRGGGKEKPLRKLAAIGKKEDKKNLKENDSTSVLQIIDILKQANLDGETLQYVLEEIGMDEQMWKQLNVTYGNPVSFSDIREEDEPTAADLKKKDSVATISNKLQKLTAKMKKKAKEFKEAEGKAKDKIKDELKDMTAEKKKLEKSL